MKVSLFIFITQYEKNLNNMIGNLSGIGGVVERFDLDCGWYDFSILGVDVVDIGGIERNSFAGYN